MSLVLYRIDDRLIHGQVVVGWGQRLGLAFIVLVDDAVRANVWEQELYRMGVPGAMDVVFATVAEAAPRIAEWEADARKGLLLTGDVETMVALCAAAPAVRKVNVGGIHAREGRTERLRYVFLSETEAQQLAALAARGVEVTAQDLPTAKPVPVAELL
ncbi:MAG TPA: PTS sugar transporter subunit IIB [Gemmatimonadales bacterium]|nr:PTS sugar transporter subunit IIB [Gemmatimonadales bacterium]